MFDTSVDRRRLGRRSAALDVETSGGTWSARTLIVGAGGLSEPKMPEIDGIETFQGDLFHSAQWNHDVDLAGKRVAVIGTGASVIQIVPELQKIVGSLDVYQRTAPWVIPRNDRTYGDLEKKALRYVPGLQRLYRAGVYWAKEVDRARLHAVARRSPSPPRPRRSRTSRRASRTPSCARR